MKMIQLLQLGALLTLCACMNGYTPYERPELFYPEGELQRQRIENLTEPKKIEIMGPSNGNLTRNGGPYPIRVYDNSCQTNEAPKIDVFPPAAKNGEPTREDDQNLPWWKIEIDSAHSSLEKAQELTVRVRACQAATMTEEGARKGRLLLTRKYRMINIHSSAKPKLEIQGPPNGILARNGGPYPIRVYDNSCQTNEAPKIDVFPPAAKNGEPTREDDQNSPWWKIEIDSAHSSLEKAQELTVRVRACQAATMTKENARKKGLLLTRKYLVTQESYSPLSTKLIPWSKDDTAQEFGKVFANSFIAADLVFVNHNRQSLLIYGSTVKAKIRFLVSREDAMKIYSAGITEDPAMAFAGKEGDKLKGRLNFKESYRPMSYSDVLAIFNHQQKTNYKQHWTEILKSAGEVLTGVAFFGVGTDFTKGVSFFTGILNPEIEKHLLRDVLMYTENLENRSLKEIEEVGPHSELRRVVFFPRRPIFGVLPEMPVYIAEIRPDEAVAQATLINKIGTIGK